MKKMHTYIILIVFAIFLVCGIAILVKSAENSKRAQVCSTMKSISAALYSQTQKGDKKIEELLLQNGEGWYSLTDDKYDEMITEIAKSNNIDYWTGGQAPKILLDPWGHRFIVCYRKVNQNYEILIVSKGPDGIYGTKDDLVGEYGSSPPQLN